MAWFARFRKETRATAAVEMALVTPLLLIIMFGSVEAGNYFLAEHALVKNVRDGVRYASRLPLETSYTCAPPQALTGAETEIRNVTRTGTIDGSGDPRRPFATGSTPCTGSAQTVTVSVRCVDKDTYPGLWRSLATDIPVVRVQGAVAYQPVVAGIAFDATSLCLRADSELPAIGL